MAKLQDYQQSTARWRAVLADNQRRTRCVIISFILLYLCVGLCVDLFIYYSFSQRHWPAYYQHYGVQLADLVEMLRRLITFQYPPRATIIMLAISGISIFVAYLLNNRIMLYGTDYREISSDSARTMEEKQFYNVVEEMRIAASLRYTPRVYIIHAEYMNAFASGVSEKSAMIAITDGLLQKLDRAELQAVIAHELSHIRHMDIKLTLVATVLSNIMLLVTDILFRGIIYGDKRKIPPQLLFIIFVLRIILPLLTLMLLLFLSRTREYMADAGAVELTRDNTPLANALLKIHQDTENHASAYAYLYQHTPNEVMRRSAYLYDPRAASVRTTPPLTSLFSTHPSLDSRLMAIGFHRKPD